MKNELISVVIPTYNRGKVIRKSIESVLNQSYKNIELIIIDDGSTDNTEFVVKKISDNRIKYIKLNENKGACYARNIGIKKAKGKYIAFVDSDDYLPNNSSIYSKAISILEYNQVEVVAWLWQFQDEDGNLVIDSEKIPSFFSGKKSTREFAKGFYYGSYANGLVVGVWNKLFRKEYIKDIPFEGRIYEDDKWMNQVLIRPANIFCEREFWYIYAQNNSSLTHQNFQKKNLEMLDILKNRVDLFKGEDFIYIESIRLFMNLYIEYWYAAQKANIHPYDDADTYRNFLMILIRERKICFKDFIRYSIFLVSPKWYGILVLKIRRKKL